MSGWTSLETHHIQGRAFQRPLDPCEHAFFLDGRIDGTADNIHHVVLRLRDPSQDAHLFSEANIVKAWLSTKRRHPLAAATIRLIPEDGNEHVSKPYFFVREQDLAVLRPNEIVFGLVENTQEIQQRIIAIWNGPRPLSEDLLVKLFVFHETDPQRTDIIHLIFLRAHSMTDGTADRTFMRSLLDTLARDAEQDRELAQIPLEERLAMLVPTSSLEPPHLHSLSPAIRRWRRAVGDVIYRKRPERRQGGHTLPCHLTRKTPFTPARCGFVFTLLTPEQTATVLANCRLYKITFGNAYLPLAQVAMTRVLYRRYLRGDISEEEWTYRKKQPHRASGPVNLRPYLDKTWYESGGGGELMVSLSTFNFGLPFMTLGEKDPDLYRQQELPDGAPPFVDLLTFDRFLHRSELVKKQAKAFYGHPLFFELALANHLGFLRQRLRRLESPNLDEKQEVLAVTEMSPDRAHGGSSLGNMDLLLPNEYPLPSTHPLSPFASTQSPVRAGYVPSTALETETTPRIVVESSMTQLHTRPSELYLGAVTSLKRLNVHCFYDGNVYEDDVVKEWVDEVKGAMLWYLGQTH